ncbi:MAG: inosine 5'-monophosphate dehydrogenase [Methanomassiliicoccales archaeon PtaU1.Bin124]|nr:MAG: inosine 5'-monophosphate dehydrogenase [Methanomassiliicoccales archaeon PtaU1.Bin124]
MVGDNIEAIKRREMLRSEIDKNNLEDLMSTKFSTVDPEMGLSDVVAKMRAENLHEIPVVNGKKLLGVVSFGTIIRKKNTVIGQKAKHVMEIPPTIKTSTEVTEVAEQFISTGYRNLPVMKGTALVGLVSRADIIGIVKDLKEIRTVPVKDVMSPDVKAVAEKDKVKDALEQMRKLDIRTVPVVDKDFRLSGIIGIKDIVNYSWTGSGTKKVKKGAYTGESNPVEITVDSIMHNDPVTIAPDAKLGDAVKLMTGKKISTLPVVDKDKLKGIITKYDILEMIASVRKRDLVYMQISGLEEEDRLSLDVMEREIQSGLQKVSKITRPTLFTMHVAKYNGTGATAKYSLNGRLITEYSTYIVNAVDWNLMKATIDMMGKIERLVTEGKEVRLEKKRRGAK